VKLFMVDSFDFLPTLVSVSAAHSYLLLPSREVFASLQYMLHFAFEGISCASENL